jgi:c-di-GMP-specific phosphodiesterase
LGTFANTSNGIALQNSNICNFTINEQGIVTLVNKNACKMFGFTEEDLIGQNIIRILMPESHRAKHDQYIQNHMETGVQKMIGTDRYRATQRWFSISMPTGVEQNRKCQR